MTDNTKVISVKDSPADTPADARICEYDSQQLASGGTVVSAKAWRLLGNELRRYAEDLRMRGLSEKTVRDYVWALRDVYEALRASGLGIKRKSITQVHVDYLVNVRYAGCAQSYIAHNLSLFRQHLKWAGNKQVDRIRWPVRGSGRPNADWLEDHEAMTLKREAQGIERMIVHCELDLGLRRVEVLRLRVDSFRQGRANSVLVHGKGRHGGKWRTIPWGKDTAAELEGYLRIRDAVIVRAKRKNPGVSVPDDLLIYERNGRLGAYKKSALENILRGLKDRTGIRFGNHTLRRTCGRMMWRAGVPIETIARIFGHSDSKTTMLYLGIDLADMDHAMELLAQYQESVKCPEKGILGVSQENRGPCGISGQETDWLTTQNAPSRARLPGRSDLL